MPGSGNTAVKSVFITGAGSGMGRRGVRLFHANGWRVGAADRNADGLAALAREFGADRQWTRPVDVTVKADLDGALADFCAGNASGGLDMMWSNAGIGEAGWSEDVPVRGDDARRRGELQSGADLGVRHAPLPKENDRQPDVNHVRPRRPPMGCRARPSTRRPSMPSKGLTEALSVEWSRDGVARRRRSSGADRHRHPHHDAQPLQRRCDTHHARGTARDRAEERYAAVDAGEQRGRGRVAGLPPSEAAALVREPLIADHADLVGERDAGLVDG